MGDILVPEPVLEIVQKLEAAGYETWAVGGGVRDAMLGRFGVDWDLATLARPAEVQKLFKKTVPVGLSHGTVGVFGRDRVLYEVTTFRQDVETFGRKARVSFSDSIDDDLARRDFTVNAMAWHPVRKELRDPFGGRQDLSMGVLKAVGNPSERFREDYLRILRAFRFAGRLDFSVDGPTWDGICAAVRELSTLSQERIREELGKVLALPAPSKSLALYQDSGALSEVFPHFTGTLDEEAWSVIDGLSPDRPLLRTAALLAYGGGASCEETWPGCGERDGQRYRRFRELTDALAELRFSTKDAQLLGTVVAAGLTPSGDLQDPFTRRCWLAVTGPRYVCSIARVWFAVARARGDTGPDARALEVTRAIRRDLHHALPLSAGDLAISGEDLARAGVPPGPKMGATLQSLLREVWRDPSFNSHDRLVEAVRRSEAGREDEG